MLSKKLHVKPKSTPFKISSGTIKLQSFANMYVYGHATVPVNELYKNSPQLAQLALPDIWGKSANFDLINLKATRGKDTCSVVKRRSLR